MDAPVAGRAEEGYLALSPVLEIPGCSALAAEAVVSVVFGARVVELEVVCCVAVAAVVSK